MLATILLLLLHQKDNDEQTPFFLMPFMFNWHNVASCWDGWRWILFRDRRGKTINSPFLISILGRFDVHLLIFYNVEIESEILNKYIFFFVYVCKCFSTNVIVLIYDAGSFNNNIFLSYILSSSWIFSPKYVNGEKENDFLYSLAKGCWYIFLCWRQKNMEDLYFNHIQNRVYLLYCNVISHEI